jgi:hypothetical protein
VLAEFRDGLEVPEEHLEVFEQHRTVSYLWRRAREPDMISGKWKVREK